MKRALVALAVRFFALGLLFFPAEWRVRTGPEARRAFADQCADVLRRSGVRGLLRLLIRTPWHLARGAWRERRDPVAEGARDDIHGRRERRMRMRMRGMGQDFRFALRALRRDPGFALVAAGLLALGIGSSTGIFAAANALLVRPLPGLDRPHEVVALGLSLGPSPFSTFPHPLYEQIRDGVEAFDGAVTATSEISVDLRLIDQTRKARAELVAGNYFSVLGVGMSLGRGFTPEETGSVGGPLVVVLSHSAWVDVFGGDPSALGRSLDLNGSPFTVVGVTAEDFVGTSFTDGGPELWVPLSTQPVVWPVDWSPLTSMEDFWLSLYGRLSGVPIEHAAAQMDAVAFALREAYPDRAGDLSFRVTHRLTVPNPAVRERLGRTMGLLLAAVGLLLTIVCVNLANLSLGRAMSRRREVGIRVALGAGRHRLIRQLLFESLSLSLAGGAVGLLVARGVSGVVLALARVGAPASATLDMVVAAFALVVSVAAGAIFGIAPALSNASVGPRSVLGHRSGVGERGVHVRRALAVGQVALSTTLVVVSALFARSLRNMQGIDLGFEPNGVLLAAVDLRTRGLSSDEGIGLYRVLLERTEALPGVSAAGLVLNAPLTGARRSGVFRVEGRRPREGEELPSSIINHVSPGYFATLHVPLLRGRDFTFEDRVGSPQVAIVNESFAEWVWPGEDPIGRRVGRGGPESPWIEVVGVVADSRSESVEEAPRPSFFLPILQRYEPRARLVVRARDPLAIVSAVREELRSLDSGIPLFATTTLRSQVSAQTASFRLTAGLTGAFSTVAVVLAALGLYGLLGYTVSCRTREIGVRMALGARAAEVTGMVTREGLVLATLGLALGLVGGAAAGHVARAMLYGIGPLDATSFAFTAVLLGGVAAIASWLPARRASRVDPMVALRSE